MQDGRSCGEGKFSQCAVFWIDLAVLFNLRATKLYPVYPNQPVYTSVSFVPSSIPSVTSVATLQNQCLQTVYDSTMVYLFDRCALEEMDPTGWEFWF